MRRTPLVLLMPLAVAAALFAAESDDGRWLFQGAEYRTQVLAQPTSPSGDLKHIEWTGWGFAGQDTTEFLVYDPADKLASAEKNKAGKYPGIPCEVPSVRALEPHWYLVTFYTNQDWGVCLY